MPEETHSKSIDDLSSTDLACERTMLAHERTLMAWIRTAISMITFGFTIYKFFAELSQAPENEGKIVSPRVVGMIMIFFGFLSLLLALIQHQIGTRKLRKQFPSAPKSVSSVLSVLILLFGLALFLAALFRQ